MRLLPVMGRLPQRPCGHHGRANERLRQDREDSVAKGQPHGHAAQAAAPQTLPAAATRTATRSCRVRPDRWAPATRITSSAAACPPVAPRPP